MAKTDTNGRTPLFVQPNIINYKLFFSGDCGNFTSLPQKIIRDSDRFTVTGGQSLLASAEAIQSADISLTYVNSTQTYVFDWNDGENIVTRGCLYVYRTKEFVQTTNYSQCTSGASGSLIYTLTGNLTDTSWTAKGVLETSTTFSTYSFRGPDVDFRTSVATWGTAGIAWALIFLMAMVMVSSGSAAGIIFSAVATLAIFITLGVVAGGGSVVIGLVILGGVMLYKLRSG